MSYYDPEHASAHCLMGRVQAYQFRNHGEACCYFEQALMEDPVHLDTYRHYSNLLIEMREYAHAGKLIEHSFTIKGVDLAVMRKLKGLLAEYQGRYDEAVQHYNSAVLEAYNQEFIDSINTDIERVQK